MTLDFQQLLREERARLRQQRSGKDITAVKAAQNVTSQSAFEEEEKLDLVPLESWSPRPHVANLEKYRQGDIPSIYVINDWMSENEEAAILNKVYAIPDSSAKWVKLKKRRLQLWGGVVESPFHPEKLPAWIEQLNASLVEAGLFSSENQPNHALINEYGPGDGIMPHQDGPSYFPFVAILSAGADADMAFRPHRSMIDDVSADGAAADRIQLHFTVKRRSLLLFTDEAYTRFLHSIDNVQGGTRISITLRNAATAQGVVSTPQETKQREATNQPTKHPTMAARISLNIGMFGCGTVGGGVYELLHNPAKIKHLGAMGVQATIAKICVQNVSKQRNLQYFSDKTKMTASYDDILNDSSINCIIELMGGVTDAKDVVFKAIRNGKHVITANKALVANHMTEIVQLLKENPTVRFGYEASVCGGIPIIHTLQNAYGSDEIREIAGIMNGTTNYMLSKMENEGIAYEAVLKEAQDLGYAEANPSADVDGFDVQSKIAILAKLGFGGIIDPPSIPTLGISRISTVDFEYAKMMNSTIKLLGVAKLVKPADEAKGTDPEISVFVSPVVVPRENVIASIGGATNLVNIRSSNLLSSAYVGQGAGRFPTANSVMNDVIQLARGEGPFDPFKQTRSVALQPDFEAHFYVRMKITDGVGIIRAIGQLAEQANVSINAILQSPITDRKNVEFVLTTDLTSQSRVREMCQNISNLSFVQEEPLFIPML
ncbi:TPA: hypothetical protein N0F65_001067 [Lagenidium giganteum]|uniref:Homoserine dehydrogenase n=1 Tax=Lagenidium giganteum TaxID=4803 RepID=A0AAV2YI03_9STRA|nr:TPA: hypothetical protein N0F65_001067 [Lagenidium giganteum]